VGVAVGKVFGGCVAVGGSGRRVLPWELRLVSRSRRSVGGSVGARGRLGRLFVSQKLRANLLPLHRHQQQQHCDHVNHCLPKLFSGSKAENDNNIFDIIMDSMANAPRSAQEYSSGDDVYIMMNALL
jgi:hypothetical protein